MDDVRCLQWFLDWCLDRCLDRCLDQCLDRCLVFLVGIETGTGVGSILGNFCVFLSYKSLLELFCGLLSLGFHTLSKVPFSWSIWRRFVFKRSGELESGAAVSSQWLLFIILHRILSSVAHFHGLFMFGRQADCLTLVFRRRFANGCHVVYGTAVL